MRTVRLQGTVTPYKGNGRRLGYPTANVQTNTSLADGVYFGYASLGDLMDRPALIFIGVPTTLGDRDRRVEVHLLDILDRDYYGEPLSVAVYHYHRANQTFADVETLLTAMKADEVAARSWFQENPLAKTGDLGDT